MKTIRGKAIPPPYAAVALAAALALAMVALVSYGLWQERETDMQEARVKTRNLTLALEEHARQSLRRVELLLLRAADALRLASASQRTDPAELRRRLRPLLPVDGFVRDFEFLDREGRSVASSGGDSAGLPQAAGRDYFAVHRDHPHQGTFIGAPHRDSSGGKWILPVSVRIALPDGSFLGVLVAVVDPGSLQPFYDSIDTGANGGVAMFLRSGWIVVRSPFDEKVRTTHWIHAPIFQRHLPQAETGTVRQIAVPDQVDRIYSYRALKEYPVVVYLGLSVRDVLAPWRMHAWAQGAVLLAALAVLAVFAALLARQLGRRESMAKALAQSEQRFRAIYEQAAVGIAIRALDGRWLQVNQKLCDILGYNREELLARTSIEMTPVDERDEAEEHNERIRRGELRTYSREKRYLHKDGHRVPVMLTANVVHGADGKPSHLVSVIEDITERVRSQELARSADERLRAAVEDLSESVVLTDAEDRIVFVNRRARELNANVQAHLEPGRRYEDFLRALVAAGDVPEAAGREETWLAERLAMRRDAAGPFEQKRQDGIWQLVTDQRLPDGGIITIGLQITERKRAEEALQNANVELERRVAARTAELRAAYQELESFSYSVSHDLRAPLRAISGFSNILRDEEGERLSAEGRRYLAVIDENARRMGKLVDALLELVRLSRQALERAPLDMAAIARGVCGDLSEAYPRARIDVDRMPPAAGDATLVRQVYANLIGNALKYSSRAESPRVEIGAEPGADGTDYFVRDNGAGFDMAYGAKLFKPFERLHTGPEYQGTGIGLALVRLIIQRHGGTIRAEGSPGRGAVFRFTLGNAAAAG